MSAVRSESSLRFLLQPFRLTDVLRNLHEAAFDGGDHRRLGLRFRQAEHGEGAVGLHLEETLHERAGLTGVEAAVDHEDAGPAVAVNAEVGCDQGGAVDDLGGRNPDLLEGRQQTARLGRGNRIRDEIEARGHHQFARRLEARPEWIVGDRLERPGARPGRHVEV